jgi:NAD(P)-dependent dehydrogenase (short-subunit alcohol dehydrogenase family)
MKLDGKVAVVTGGARGMGAAICRRYAEEDARVAVADILADEAQALAEEIGRGAFAVQLDVKWMS